MVQWTMTVSGTVGGTVNGTVGGTDLQLNEPSVSVHVATAAAAQVAIPAAHSSMFPHTSGPILI